LRCPIRTRPWFASAGRHGFGILPRRFVEEISGNFALDIHELPIETPEQFLYMMWHANSELDPRHKWLRESMMRTVQTNQSATDGRAA
jgi:DNA-binding transcriptional LysR family regulator